LQAQPDGNRALLLRLVDAPAPQVQHGDLVGEGAGRRRQVGSHRDAVAGHEQVPGREVVAQVPGRPAGRVQQHRPRAGQLPGRARQVGQVGGPAYPGLVPDEVEGSRRAAGSHQAERRRGDGRDR